MTFLRALRPGWARGLVLVGALALLALLATFALAPKQATANYPACNNGLHVFSDSGCAFQRYYETRCALNIRRGPGVSYALHDGPVAGTLSAYRTLATSSANAGCGGGTTTYWLLDARGWYTRSGVF